MRETWTTHMRDPRDSLPVKCVRWALPTGAILFTSIEAIAWRDALLVSPAVLAFLTLGGLLAAGASRRFVPADRGARLALTFPLAAYLLLPYPGALIVGMLSSVAGAGGGVAGRRRRGALSFTALAGGLVAGHLVYSLLSPPAVSGVTALLTLYLLFAVVQLVTGALGLALAPDVRGACGWRAHRRVLAVESIGVLFATLLFGSLQTGRWFEACVVAGGTVITGVLLAGLLRDRVTLRRSRRELHSRVAELDTLHAIGREVLSSVDPAHVFAVVDRECRKVLDVERCTVALSGVGDSALAVAFESRSTAPSAQPRPGSLLQSVFDTRVPGRVHDAHALPPRDELRLQHAGSRSGIGAPLIVDGRPIGVLSVECPRAAAFEPHHTVLLTTIAQQAAVAIENSRNYQRATIDTLTGCYSRDYFFRRLEEEHRRQDRYGNGFAVMMLDLDGFKGINDRWGHLAGDRYLAAVADTIRAELREADIACRYGGDEFCLLLPETGLDGAHAIAERIRGAVERAGVPTDGARLHATVSVGVAAFPNRATLPLEGVLRRADDALYRAKEAGRNCVVPVAA